MACLPGGSGSSVYVPLWSSAAISVSAAVRHEVRWYSPSLACSCQVCKRQRYTPSENVRSLGGPEKARRPIRWPLLRNKTITREVIQTNTGGGREGRRTRTAHTTQLNSTLRREEEKRTREGKRRETNTRTDDIQHRLKAIITDICYVVERYNIPPRKTEGEG